MVWFLWRGATLVAAAAAALFNLNNVQMRTALDVRLRERGVHHTNTTPSIHPPPPHIY